ncbi:fatty acid desaturase [Crocosphaera sp.]|uniref:fatty acid desaturase n=1 Tax=Crocosphaera sp. TaxID=2729996 RepID=UPI00341A10C3
MNNFDFFTIRDCLFAVKNIGNWVNWLMGGLPYHSIHHAFPAIPFDKLPEAYQAVQIVLKKHNQIPLEMETGYWQSSIKHSRVHSSQFNNG